MNPSDPAFPKLPTSQSDMGQSWPGLSKREWFAGMAMQGLLVGAKKEQNIKNVVNDAVSTADALVAELSNQEGK